MKKNIVGSLALLGFLSAGTSYAQEAGDWTDTVEIGGDLRLRYEHIDDDKKSDTRDRFRYRARIKMKADVNDEIKVGFQFASGSDDPVSTNESFDGGGSSKGFNIDKAYLTWAASEELSVTAGKQKNPFRLVNDLLWDSDLNLEGASATYKAGPLLANVGVFVAEERSSDDETMLYGGQLAANIKLDGPSILAGVGYFKFDNTQGFAPIFDEEDSFGNSTSDVTDEAGEVTGILYTEEYGEFEAFGKIKGDIGVPAELFFDYVVNTEADSSEDTGYQVGVKVGKAKAVGTIEGGYYWRHLENDAVIGAWTDSDFGGGGTGAEGHKVWVKYQAAKNVQLALALLVNEVGLVGESTDYNRLQLDLIAKF